MGQPEDKKRRELFCVLSARGFPPEEAARRAGYPFQGDWARTAAELLSRPVIRRRIARLVKELAFCAPKALARAGLERLALGGVEDAADLLDEETGLPANLPLLHVAELKKPKGGGVELKFFDRVKALSLLAELDGGEESRAGSLLEALERSARQLGEESDG